MRSVFIPGSLIVAALSTTACLQDSPRERGPIDVDRDAIDDTDRPYQPIRGAVDGVVRGTVGPLSGLDHEASLLSAYDDGFYLSVETVIELDDRAVMTLLSVSNGAEIFQPGLHETFSLVDFDTEGLQVTMLGCVGQGVGIYDEYDAPADEVIVDVVEGLSEQEIDVALEARWFDHDMETGARLETFRSAATSFTLLR